MKRFHYITQLIRHAPRLFAFKVISIAMGLLVSLLLFARVSFEWGYDTFYADSECLHLVKTAWVKEDRTADQVESWSEFTLMPIPQLIAEAFPDRVKSGTISCCLLDDEYKVDGREKVAGTIAADTLYFQTMGLELVQGHVQELADPYTLYLSEEGARRFFGDASPIGKTVQYTFLTQTVELTVRGVFRDLPYNTALHKRPEAVVSISGIAAFSQWGTGWQSGGNYDGFVRLRSPHDAGWVNQRLTAVVARYLPPDFGYTLAVRLVPVSGLHLAHANVLRMIWIMLLLGLVVLFTTTFNYVLVAISSIGSRAKAIGVHKSCGASKWQVFSMFLLETGLVVGMALLLDVLIVAVFYDYMEELVSLPASTEVITYQLVPLRSLFAPSNLLAQALAVALLFLLGGCLPAWLLMRIPVTQVFHRYKSRRSGWKRCLLCLQFICAVFVMGMLWVVISQYAHMRKRDWGWNSDRLATLYLREADPALVRDAVRRLPFVEGVATASRGGLNFGSNRPVTDEQGNELFYPRNGWFDSGYLPFIGLKLKEGHNLTGKGQLLVNTTFCQRMGWTESPIGQQVGSYGTVVGLLDSFSMAGSAKDAVPVMIEWEEVLPVLTIRLKEPFAKNLQRLNEELQQQFPQAKTASTAIDWEWYTHTTQVFCNVVLLATIALCAIVLLGLVGYADDEVRLRSKEIAIRKVNGATATDIIRLLLHDVGYMLLPALATGSWMAWRCGRLWIDQYDDAVQITPAAYVGVALAVSLFIFAVLLLRTWRVAHGNLIQNLRSE